MGRPKNPTIIKCIMPKCTTEDKVIEKEENGVVKRSTKHFYKNEFVESGFDNICKDCLKEQINNAKDEKERLSNLLYYLKMNNKPFIQALYDASLDHSRGFIAGYNIQMNSIGGANWGIGTKYNGWEDSDDADSINFDTEDIETFPNQNDKGIEQTKKSKSNKNKSKETNNELENDETDEEEKIYSSEFMGYYTQSDIDYLTKYLKGLYDDFNIITTNHKDYAKKIAKASLHMDRCFEDMLQGMSGADKRYKDAKDVFDSLSKSAQFAESGRGATSAGINGISEVVDKIEMKEWIYDNEEFEEDALDHLLDQFGNIKKSL